MASLAGSEGVRIGDAVVVALSETLAPNCTSSGMPVPGEAVPSVRNDNIPPWETIGVPVKAELSASCAQPDFVIVMVPPGVVLFTKLPPRLAVIAGLTTSMERALGSVIWCRSASDYSGH